MLRFKFARATGLTTVFLLTGQTLGTAEVVNEKSRRAGGGGGGQAPLGTFVRDEDRVFNGEVWQCGRYWNQRLGDTGGPFPACQLKGGIRNAQIAVIFRQDWTMKIVYPNDPNVYNAPRCNAFCSDVGGLTHGTTCFYVPPVNRAWSSAKTFCEQDSGGMLATITSDAENKKVNDLFIQSGTKSSYGGMWIGASAPTNNHDDWRWVDGSVLQNGFTSWASPSEPNNFGDNEYCAEYYYKPEQWNDDWCGRVQPFVCRRPERHTYCPVIEHLQEA